MTDNPSYPAPAVNHTLTSTAQTSHHLRCKVYKRHIPLLYFSVYSSFKSEVQQNYTGPSSTYSTTRTQHHRRRKQAFKMAHPVLAKSFRDLIGVPRSSASPTDSSLIIIDAQNEYATGQLKTENVESTRAAISTLLEAYRAAGKSENIIHVTHKVPDGAPVFTPNTDLAKEFSELTPKEGEKVVEKQFPGSFTGTDLGEYLEKTGAKKVVLTGYQAHLCVSTTARQAAEKGIDVVLVREAIGDRDIPGTRAAELVEVVLNELGDAFGTVVSVDDVK